MEPSEKDLIYRVTAEYLRCEAPQELEEFEEDFEFTFQQIERQLASDPQVARDADGGLRFDSPFVDHPTMVTVLWIVTLVVRELVHGQQVAELKRQLHEQSKALQCKVGKIFAVIEPMAEEFQRLRDEDLGPSAWEALATLPRADLVLLVGERRLVDGRRVLTYQLGAPDPGRDCFESKPLRRDPGEYSAELFRDLEGLAEGAASDRGGARERLAGFGLRLCEELFPEKLRRELWSLHRGAETMPIVSHESWIPWELLKLRDPDDGSSGPFLAAAVAVTRWLHDRARSLELAFPLRRLALVVPRDSQLPSAPLERAYITSLEGDGREVVPIPARLSAVIDALASGHYDGWHFTGHGLAQGRNPDRWSLLLEGGDELQATHLQGAARNLGRARPLVFLNACRSGRGGDSLTGIGGLAQAFLAAGAGAVVGSHWALRDEKAKTFAEGFYQAFLSGVPIAEAGRQARLRVRAAFPGDSTWLAYTIYAHPLASCRGRRRGGWHRGGAAGPAEATPDGT